MKKDQNGSFVWLLRQSGERKGKFVTSVILAAISMLCGIVPYYFIARIVKDLLAGYRVAVMKNSEEWNLSLGGIKKLSSESVSEENKQKRKGLTYEDYLRYLLFSQDRGEQIFRISDIIQMNMCREYNPQFRLSECMIDIEVETNYQIKRLFTEIGFLKREIYDGSKGFVIQTTQSYGY